ncbi:MAG: hypothetical protein FWH40_09875 [Coriobacteriia bacterium]|nr:hypothetical protein [Coriobacteriia bacterium]
MLQYHTINISNRMNNQINGVSPLNKNLSVYLEALEAGGGLARWEAEGPRPAKERKAVLEALAKKLWSPQPPEKKVSQYRLYRCEWEVGDVYSYQIECEASKGIGLFGRHLLFQKVDENIWHPGHIIPIVYVKLTQDDSLPGTLEEYDTLEYVQVSIFRYDPSYPDFRPDPASLTEEEYLKGVEVIRQGLAFDEYGCLPEFRVKLINTSKRIIPKKLAYCGNYANAAPPKNEYLRKDKISILAMPWKSFGKTIDEALIERYQAHNLRQLPIYQKEDGAGGL